MAAADELRIRVAGKGGHAALPHRTVDPIVAAAHVITALQTVVSRSCDPTQPSVLTIGKDSEAVTPAMSFRTRSSWTGPCAPMITATAESLAVRPSSG